MKKYINPFIKEILPIIAGILIALYINNWNENRKDEKYINYISSSINAELTETNENIIDIISVQKSFIDTLDFYSNDNKVSLLEIAIKANGIQIPTIKINSWKAVSNSKIELLEFNKVSIMAEIEDSKEILKMKAEKLANFIYSNTRETEKDKKELMKIMMLDIISTEKSIQQGIESIIND